MYERSCEDLMTCCTLCTLDVLEVYLSAEYLPVRQPLWMKQVDEDLINRCTLCTLEVFLSADYLPVR